MHLYMRFQKLYYIKESIPFQREKNEKNLTLLPLNKSLQVLINNNGRSLPSPVLKCVKIIF